MPACLAGLLVFGLALARVFAQTAPPAPDPAAAALIQQMVTNGLQDRQEQTFWLYRIQRREAGHLKSEVQVETAAGPVYRILSIDNHPLDPAQAKAEHDRLQHLLDDPSAQRKVKQAYDEDEARLRQVMQLLPSAFFYNFDGREGANLRLRFRPNPSFDPPTFETRPLRSLAGTILIDEREKRLVDLKGQLVADVQFGFGLLGRIYKGSTFEVAREPVSPTHWKTDRVDVHVSGHVILFKTISKDQDEVRSGFRQTPSVLTLKQAVDLLEQQAAVP